MTRRVLALALLAAALAAEPAAAAPADAGSARLLGRFLLTGRVTSARNVLGERRGARVLRGWDFQPECVSGPCAQTVLYRSRGSEPNPPVDRLVLDDRGHGRYVGHGRFYVPLRCGGQTVAHGESVPFTITVRVTAVQVVLGVLLATRISATYVNHARHNLTRCVAIPGHDAAAYTGALTGGN